LEAAETVCASNRIETRQVLTVMSHLVDKSLVSVELRIAEPRYHFLETLRQYASEKLSESGEIASARNRHLNYFARLAEHVAQEMGGAEQLAGHDRLEEERDNWRAALTWSIEIRSDEEGLRLASALWWFWQVRGYWREGGNWLRRILETTRDGPAPESARLKALIAAAGLAWRQNQMDWAAELCQEALPLCQKLGDRKGEAFCNGTLGAVAWYQGNLSEAKTRHGEALRIRRQIQDMGNIAYSLGNLALVSWSEGNFHEAAKLADESVTVSRNEGSRWQVAEAFVKRATVARAQGDFELARALYTESLKIRRAMADKPNIPFELEGLAALALQDDPHRAARLWGAAEKLRQTTNSPLMPAYQKDYAPLIAGVRAELGPAAFDAAWAEGQALTLEQAVEEALVV
jgi:tetratricopeptide (TPR) repeat protein